MTGPAATSAWRRYPTSFVGRTADRPLLHTLLGGNRAVTLLGPGGVGKTRLASVCAADSAQRYDGVFPVDLDGCRTPVALLAEVASVLGVRDGGAAEASTLVAVLEGRRSLVILDGCELLDAACLTLLRDLLDVVPGLTLLMTSRRLPHLDGAASMALAPLAVPPDRLPHAAPPRAADIASCESVQLLVDRARLVRPTFAVTDDNAASVATLCRRLDGLPLTLEFAATWLRMLSVDQIVERLRDSAEFPRAGTSDTPERHRTVRSLAAGTYELCTPDEQRLWSRMAVFAGSVDLAAVEATCGARPLDTPAIVDGVAALLDQSVLMADDAIAEQRRYRMLGVMRQYGAEQLADRAQVLARHRRHYESVVADFTRNWPGPNQLRLMDRLLLDYPDIVAAIDRGLDDAGSARASAAMAADLWNFWFCTGRLSEGREVLGRVLASPHLDRYPAERTRCLYVSAYLCALQDHLDTAEKTLAAGAGFDGDPLNTALGLQVTAMVLAGRQRLDAAVDLLDQAIDRYAAIDDPRATTLFMDAIGIAVLLAALRGETGRAHRLGERGRSACDQCGDAMWRGYLEYALGVDAWLQHDVPSARAAALAVVLGSRDELLITHCIELAAWCASHDQNHDTAATLFGYADRMWRFLGGRYSGFRAIAHHHDTRLTATRAALSASRFAAAFDAGARLPRAEIVALMDTRPAPADAAGRLTARERQVAELLADGLSNRDIATALTISPRTAESHVEHILTKLGLANRTQVAAWLLHRGGGAAD